MDDVRWEVEVALSSLARQIEFPPTPDIAGRVTSQIESQGLRRGFAWRRLNPSFGVAALIAAAAVALVVFSPTTRDAIADWIGLDGVRITFDDGQEAAIAEELLLGERVSLDEARERAGFAIETLPALGDPDEVYVREDRPGARVTMVYEAGPDLPETEETRVGALFGQFLASDVDDVTIKKSAPGTRVQAIVVDGNPGYWLGGGPHIVAFTRPDGSPGYDQVRLAGNTLVWQRDGVVYRLESALNREAALEIAESLP